jgi:hypothetical protein
MGMRKDFIHSEEERQQRKKRLEENRTMTSQRLLSISESINSLSSSNRSSNSESLSPTFDDLDHVSFYFLLLYRNKRNFIFCF